MTAHTMLVAVSPMFVPQISLGFFPPLPSTTEFSVWNVSGVEEFPLKRYLVGTKLCAFSVMFVSGSH